MDGLAFSSVSSTTTASLSTSRLWFPSLSTRIRIRRKRDVSFTQKSKFTVFASKEEERKLDKWDQMELKFGRLLGEDPKLTLAKIMSRKANPNVSYLEAEKSFYKEKGKLLEVEEVPLDWSKEKKPSSSLDGLNLVKPVPKKGIKFEAGDKPVVAEIKKPSQSAGNAGDNINKGRVPKVILRKPTIFKEDDVEDKPSRFRLRPNLSLKMRNEQSKEKFSDMTLLRKPEPMREITVEMKEEFPSNVEAGVMNDGSVKLGKEGGDGYGGFTQLKRPEMKAKLEEEQELGDLDAKVTDFIKGKSLDTEPEATATTEATSNGSVDGMQPLEQRPVEPAEEENATSDPSDKSVVNSCVQSSAEAALQGKPPRLDQSVKETSKPSREEKVLAVPEGYGSGIELKNLPMSPLEGNNWNRAEDLLNTGERIEVELVSSSTRGFVVSFGTLIGFLPYRNLAAKWKFLAFESWLKQKGLDPLMYRQNLGVIGSQDFTSENSSLVSSLDEDIDKKIEEVSPDMKLEDLLRIYDQEKLKFLSSFVGQRIKVNLAMADRKSRKLIFSLKPKEKEELIEKKRSLMAKLRVGDVVKCCIKKITYFGVFVEVEDVTALIHQTEVSWDATLDPASYFKIGQIVEAKVHQLDFALERIFLSLKEITPDPLIEALDSVVGDRDPSDGRLEAAEADTEWPDVESLVKELQQIEGIQSVSKGRFFLSPGLAPTFQVYMASMFENQYKLLARSGNKVQEVIVQASLGKEEMKSTILSCTNRVE